MIRSFPPAAILIWMQKLKNGASVSSASLKQLLQLKLGISAEDAQLAVANAIDNGILVVDTEKKRINHKYKLCQKPNPARQKSSDPYCFECHLPGLPETLINCSSCSRSFHDWCRRKNPEKPNYHVPSDKNQPHRFPIESDLEDEDAGSPSLEPEPNNNSWEQDNNSSSLVEENATSPEQKPNKLFKSEYDFDVEIVGEIPPTARQRKRQNEHIYIKTDEEEAANQRTTTATAQNANSSSSALCTACRLQELKVLHNPPHMDKAEVCGLLDFTWASNHTWLETDVRNCMTKQWSERDIGLIKRILFKNEILGIIDIWDKIKKQKYSFLLEFLIDLLDLQHNFGVFFGTKCKPYNATKWLIRDITHDIKEIRRCPDCFRYSNEGSKSAAWFAKPCRQRHELVYAKLPNYPHWPAKVIRVLSHLNVYDVRFFGSSHSRGLVPANDILPIDTDISNLKIKKSKGLTTALQELEYFKALSRYPAALFGFHADPRVAENAINTALSHYMQPDGLSMQKKATKRGRAKANATPQPPPRVLPKRRCSIGTANRPADIFDCVSPVTENVPHNSRQQIQYHDLAQEVLSLNEQLVRCKEQLTAMQQEVITVKRQRWCHHCLNKAVYDCCFTASYCTRECQRRDKRRHQLACRKYQSA